MDILKVPLYKQTKMACGPTALRMVLAYFDINKSLKEIIKGVGDIKSFGVQTNALAKFAINLGFKVTCYSYGNRKNVSNVIVKRPSTIDIKKFLKKKIPVIIAVRSFILNNEIKHSKMGHFIVITAYTKGVYYFNDPKGRKRQIKEEDLLFAWFNNILDSSGYLLVLEK